MIWLTWRQFRAQAAVVTGLLAVVAIILAVTGPHLVHIYDAAVAQCRAQGTAGSDCVNPVTSADKSLQVVVATLVLLGPALIGAFWGAPLIARELETGTYRLGWTQGVTRRHWLGVKVGLVGLASMAAAGLLALMVDWWTSPIEAVNANRFGIALFGLLGITSIGYAAFAFALGLVAGVLLRQAVPAMAVTLAGFVGTRLAVTYWLRPHFMSPVKISLSASHLKLNLGIDPTMGVTATASEPVIPNAWIYSSTLVDKAGHAPTSQFLDRACPALASAQARLGPHGVHQVGGIAKGSGTSRAPVGAQAFHECAARVAASYHEVVTLQPASRYWAFQGIETGLFLALAALLVGVCFWWVRRRLS